MTYEASKIWVLVLRRRKIHLLPTQERSRRLLFRMEFGDGAVSTKPKAKISCPGVENTSGLLASQSRERVSTATSLDTFDGIAHRGRDPKVKEHLSPNRLWDELGLPVRQDRWYATTASSPDI